MSINRKVSSRELRRTLNAALPVAESALKNEQITRKRFDESLARLDELEQGLTVLAEVLSRGFWGRLRWVALGR